ncbi:MAG: hydroxymethylbilane synthase [Acidobacteriota bacterium]|nr:hydroxymethylbilane synthase [Blastocatellia bacterium]MDW8411958.1 hydroxymethylbilane synthase [Acidobacteriota bacterium]
MLRIGSRGSKLALWQAEWVKTKLLKRFPTLEIAIRVIKTSGDTPDVPISKGAFTKQLQDAILRNEIDLAVHSLKDVPTEIHECLQLTAITKREEPCDALVCAVQGLKLADLPPGSKVGTSSLRRKTQLLKLRPDLRVEELRGNVDTRLRKLDSGDYDAIILAAAGLYRLGLQERISELLSPEVMIPAAGQGALAIETRRDDEQTQCYVRTLNHKQTQIACQAERAFLAALGGGCRVPVAAYAYIDSSGLHLRGCVASLDGRELIKRSICGSPEDCEILGRKLAEKLLASGADRLILEAKRILKN